MIVLNKCWMPELLAEFWPHFCTIQQQSALSGHTNYWKNIYISAINKYFTEIFKNAFRKTSNILINSKKNKKSLHNFKMFWKKSCIQMNDGVVWFRLQKQTEPIAMGCVSSGSTALKNSIIRNSENEQQKQIGITL